MANTTEPWAISEDGTVEYRILTRDYLDGALHVMKYGFIMCENVCTAIGVTQSEQACEELTQLIRHTVKDGVSIIAIEKANNKVIGACINKLQVKSESGSGDFEAFTKILKCPESINVLEFMIMADNLCDIFTLCNVDCICELMFVGTLPECRGRGVGKKMCEITIEVCQKLLEGINVKQSLDDTPLELEPVPKAITSIFTTFITQRIGKQLGFTIAAEKSYEECEYNGRNFAQHISKQTPSFTVEYKKLV